jgi:REP element-mobilizing transposase RayT
MTAESSDYPLAYFLTWTTYGTWLPGDDRGWTERRRGLQLPDFYRMVRAALRMTDDALVLCKIQRNAVEATVVQHCQIRGWTLHAVSCRTNHVHVVFSGAVEGATAREQIKAYATRKLKQLSHQPSREKWWTERGHCDLIYDMEGLSSAVSYTLDAQDRKDRDEM